MSKEGHAPHPSQEAGSRRGSQRHDPDLAPHSAAPDALQQLAGPGRADPDQVLALQRTLGNQAVQRILVQRQDPEGGGADSARIGALENRVTATEAMSEGALEGVGVVREKTDANTEELARVRDWAPHVTAYVRENRGRIENLESQGP